MAGGPAEDLTPDLPQYTLRGFDISRNGACLAFDAVYENCYWFYCIALGTEGFGSPQLVHRAREETWGCHLSRDGALLAVKSTHRAPHSRRYTTLVFDTNSGEQVAELWDGSGYSVEPIQFSPLRGDEQLLAASNAGGALRPLLWDPRSNARHDLAPPSADGPVLCRWTGPPTEVDCWFRQRRRDTKASSSTILTKKLYTRFNTIQAVFAAAPDPTTRERRPVFSRRTVRFGRSGTMPPIPLAAALVDYNRQTQAGTPSQPVPARTRLAFGQLSQFRRRFRPGVAGNAIRK